MDQGEETVSDKSRLRVGIIGAGGIGGTHTDYLRKTDRAEVVAACDVNEANLKKFASKFGVTPYGSWHEMLEKEKLDAVTVCTPNALHVQPTVDALKAGCHVMVEKPMGMSTVECRKMIGAAKAAKRHLVIGFQHRYDGRAQVLRRAFDEGVFGKILFVRVQALRRRGIPNWGVFGRKELQGGGPLIDIGVHVLELADYVIGMPEPVAAVGNTWTYIGDKPSSVASQWPNWDHKTYTVEDLAIGHIRMKNGAVIHIESSFAAHIEKDVWNFQVFGEKGGAVYEPTAIFRDDAGAMLNCAPGYIPKVDIFLQKMKQFVEVCLDGKPSQAPGEHGLIVQQMLDGIYASAAKGGREVQIK
jgi:predicted dehydrogenase